MKADTNTESDGLSVNTYKKLMKGIEFMEKYAEDPEIFIPDSEKFKNFLIHSFCFLYPDFHYLSFLRKQDVDLEIIKVSGILQILPTNTKKISKLFENMTKNEIHRFWLRFFTLFKKKKDFSTDSVLNISLDNKIDFFKTVTNTLNYLNYEFPVVNLNKINCVDINEEMQSWKELGICTATDPDELASFSSDEEQTIDADIEKLTIHLKQVLTMYSKQETLKQQGEPENVEFFINFIELTKNILQYKKNLDIINSTFFDEFNIKIFSTDENWSENLYFIKRCNNLVKTLRSKVNTLY